MSESSGKNRAQREARLRWVPITLMRVSPLAQRDLNPARVNKIAASFDLEQIGTPTVSLRDDHFYIIDGHHRIEALKQIGWGDQQIQCWAYEGLSEADEAEKFLKLNDILVVGSFAKFRVGVQAGRPVECDIDRIVRALNLRVSQDPDGIGSVGTLRKVYERSGPAVLSRALRIVRDAYGAPGMKGPVIDGIGFLCQRYNGQLDEAVVVNRLGMVHGGVNGLLGKAAELRQATGNRQGQCVAASAVDIINRGRGGKKLPSWWSADA
jgi:hypothetical protein